MKTYRFKSKQAFIEHCRGPYFATFAKHFTHWSMPFRMYGCGTSIVVNFERIDHPKFKAFGSFEHIEMIED
ncbi:hypothetical protein F485_gp391 [Aeromonas phage CC2]|uniref:Uncharacterized protein n=1 Tax=Aeromonas phage CC2 TaxID=1204516 RepID=I6X781_9CAUD|nr:hypothetical protein F485_gp391 [Aeromonas phage CC2]AFN39287.1 hypothetical protein CC2_391 [Aeromonas phage CC2]